MSAVVCCERNHKNDLKFDFTDIYSLIWRLAWIAFVWNDLNYSNSNPCIIVQNDFKKLGVRSKEDAELLLNKLASLSTFDNLKLLLDDLKDKNSIKFSQILMEYLYQDDHK